VDALQRKASKTLSINFELSLPSPLRRGVGGEVIRLSIHTVDALQEKQVRLSPLILNYLSPLL